MKIKYVLLSALLSTSVVASALTGLNATNLKADEYDFGADFQSGEFAIELERPLIYNPNTFEAWINIADDAEGFVGCIFSDFQMPIVAEESSWEVDDGGHMKVLWNSGEGNIVFDSVDLRQEEGWSHVAVTRNTNNDMWTFYLNGEKKQEVYTHTTNMNITFTHKIGNNRNNWYGEKGKFQGQIKQVSLYRTCLNADEVLRDFEETDKISYQTRGLDLTFNTYLTLGATEGIDTSFYRNNGKLVSHDYYYKDKFFETKDYSFAVIPDPQMIVTHHEHYALDTTMNYVIDHKEDQKIEALLCVGDVVNGTSNPKSPVWDREFKYGSETFSMLDDEVNYVLCPGNHDYDDLCKDPAHQLSYYNKYFPYEKFSNKPYFGGAYRLGRTENTYYLFEVAGVKYIVLAIDFGPSLDVMNWATAVCEAYPDHRAIMITHGYLDNDGSFLTADRKCSPSSYGWGYAGDEVLDGDEMFEHFVKLPKNMFMVLCGHIPTDDVIVREDVGVNGNIITSILLNAQGILCNDGLDALMGLLNFDELNQKIYINYYSSYHEKMFNIQNQFVYDFKGNTDLLSSLYYNTNGTLKSQNVPTKTSEENPNYLVILLPTFVVLAIGGAYLTYKLLKKKGTK